MPTVLRGQTGPYRFFFYSADGNEPRHVHVERENMEAKFWLDPIRLEYNHGFGQGDLRKIEALINDRIEDLREAWDDRFNP